MTNAETAADRVTPPLAASRDRRRWSRSANLSVELGGRPILQRVYRRHRPRADHRPDRPERLRQDHAAAGGGGRVPVSRRDQVPLRPRPLEADSGTRRLRPAAAHARRPTSAHGARLLRTGAVAAAAVPRSSAVGVRPRGGVTRPRRVGQTSSTTRSMGCRAGSYSACCWRWRWSRRRSCCCSTNRPRGSTSRTRRSSTT